MITDAIKKASKSLKSIEVTEIKEPEKPKKTKKAEEGLPVPVLDFYHPELYLTDKELRGAEKLAAGDRVNIVIEGVVTSVNSHENVKPDGKKDKGTNVRVEVHSTADISEFLRG